MQKLKIAFGFVLFIVGVIGTLLPVIPGVPIMIAGGDIPVRLDIVHPVASCSAPCMESGGTR
jgi:uncharacterized protein YqgC (DUF456 family)